MTTIWLECVHHRLDMNPALSQIFYCIQLIQKRLSFNNLKPLTLSAQRMMDVAYLEPRSGQIP